MSDRKKSGGSAVAAATGFDAAERMKNLLAYIYNDGVAKEKDIDTKAEQEFKTEKERLMRQERARIEEVVKRREKHVERVRKIQTSQIKNAARLRLLAGMNDLVGQVLAETRAKLNVITQKESRYKPLLERLILQGLYMMLEKDVVITCRRQDVQLVQDALVVAAKKFAADTLIQGSVVVDQEHFLPDDSSGGVELASTRGKLRVCNTLESRLELISRNLLPQIRTGLFGDNPDRKHMD
ncbi:hypothetical protein V5799_021465 [Amblyomma americanum]|uniref:Uncharacterized protein n=1 Tax=Amblyomma americanum TaxID=6943 RepID=A0AAQ4FQ07_AMBAM